MSKNFLSLLPAELVVMVASYLDVSSYLNLASSSTNILSVLGSKLQWKNLLLKTKMNRKRLGEIRYAWAVKLEIPITNTNYFECEKKDMEEEVKKLAAFLKFAEIEEGLLALLHTICERFPFDLESLGKIPVDLVSLRCPCNEDHKVSPFGFAMLELAETIVGGPEAEPVQDLLELSFDNKEYGTIVDYLEEISMRALRQKQKIYTLEMINLTTCNEREKEAFLKVLQRCESWEIGSVEFEEDNSEDNFVELIQGLAEGEEEDRGTIERVSIHSKIVSRCTLGVLKKVWNITQKYFQVCCLLCGFSSLVTPGQTKKWAKIVNSVKKNTHVCF